MRVDLSSRGIVSGGILRGGIIIRDWRWGEGRHPGVQCWEDLMPWRAWSSHQKPLWRRQQVYRAWSRSQILMVFAACPFFRGKSLLRTQIQDIAENLGLSLPLESELCFYMFPWEGVQSGVCRWRLKVSQVQTSRGENMMKLIILYANSKAY